MTPGWGVIPQPSRDFPLKVAEISPDEETIAGYDLRAKSFVVWRFSQISDVRILER